MKMTDFVKAKKSRRKETILYAQANTVEDLLCYMD
jgi:hypothetical protein